MVYLRDFVCDRCEEVQEKSFQSYNTFIALASELICPTCGELLRALPPGGTSFELKGKGWFKDGY